MIGTRAIQSWVHHCKIGARSVHCGSGESSYMHASRALFSSFDLFSYWLSCGKWKFLSFQSSSLVWFLKKWYRLVIEFYGQHAADEKFNFEHLARSTVLNQQPLLQWVSLWDQSRFLISLHCFHFFTSNSPAAFFYVPCYFSYTWTSSNTSFPLLYMLPIFIYFFPKLRPLNLELSPEEEVTVLMHMDIIRWRITITSFVTFSYSCYRFGDSIM